MPETNAVDEFGFNRLPSDQRHTYVDGNSRYVAVFAVLGFVLPLASYFWLIERYGLNTIYSDQWDDIHLIGLSYSGHLTLSNLWAQHDENRIFFPNLIVLLLARTTHFNISIEMYLSAVMLVAAIGLFVLAHKRRAPWRHWIWYCPIAILLLSFVQFQDTLWGFQMAWYLVMLSLAVALYLLDRPALNWLTLGVGIAAAIIGSFSSVQGLLIWPAGLVLIYHRRRPWSHVLAWMGTAVVAGFVYFYNLNRNSGLPSHGFAIRHPLASIRFFLFALGDVVGVRTGSGFNNAGVELLGAVIFIVAISAVITCGFRRDNTGSSPIGVALIVFGILFAAFVTESRVIYGESTSGAGASRYTTFDLLVLAGAYLTVLGNSKAGVRFGTSRAANWKTRSLLLLWIPLVVAICSQAILGLTNGISGSTSTYRSEVLAADVTVNIEHASNWLLLRTLGDGQPAPAILRGSAQIARENRLSLFATDAVNIYTTGGLLPKARRLAQPTTELAIPFKRMTLSGTTVLDARAGGATSVEFRIASGPHGSLGLVLCRGTFTRYGWLCKWNTNTVSNGSYFLRSEAINTAGNAYSGKVKVTIKNRRK